MMDAGALVVSEKEQMKMDEEELVVMGEEEAWKERRKQYRMLPAGITVEGSHQPPIMCKL